jgi:dipeptidyl aminopeptidase/acylaminoacyl peptidase
MTSHADILKAGASERPAVVPGKPDESELLRLITPLDGEPPTMPKDADALADRDVQKIRQWIAEGARDDTPASARHLIDPDHPPVYTLPPIVTALAYSPDGSLLAVSGYHEVLLYKPDGSALVGRLVGLSERIQALAFSPDGKELAVAGGSPCRFGEVQVWDVARRRLKLSVPITFDTIYGVSWAPDGSKIAFGCADNSLRAIDTGTGKQVLFQGAHSDWVLATVFSRGGTHIASVSRDRSMKLTEVATQRFIDNVTSITPGALKGGLQAVALRPRTDNAMSKPAPDVPGAKAYPYDELLVGGSDGAPRLYKMHREVKRVIGDDANKVKDYEGMPGRIFACAFSADGKHFAAGSSSDFAGEVRVYETDSAKRLSQFEVKGGGIYTVAFAPDGKTVAAGGFDGVIRLLDAATGKVMKEFVAVPLGKSK